MSTRTILEVNNDYAHVIGAITNLSDLMVDALNPGRTGDRARHILEMAGIRVLTQRHHSDAVTVNVNGRVAFTENTGA